jgi:hypothetical protein
LIKARWITFEDAPNINYNPLFNHDSSNEGVNVVEFGERKRRF